MAMYMYLLTIDWVNPRLLLYFLNTIIAIIEYNNMNIKILNIHVIIIQFVVLIFFGSVDEEDEYIFTTKDAGRELLSRIHPMALSRETRLESRQCF